MAGSGDTQAVKNAGKTAKQPFAARFRAFWRRHRPAPYFWRKSHNPQAPFARWVYVVVFLFIDCLTLAFFQWSVTLVDPLSGFFHLFGAMFTGRFVFVLNLLILSLIYFIFIALFNRFWVGTFVFEALAMFAALVERMKVEVRNEAILPSDLKLAQPGGSNHLTDFIPDDSGFLIAKMLCFIATMLLLCVILAIRSGSPARLLPTALVKRRKKEIAKAANKGVPAIDLGKSASAALEGAPASAPAVSDAKDLNERALEQKADEAAKKAAKRARKRAHAKAVRAARKAARVDAAASTTGLAATASVPIRKTSAEKYLDKEHKPINLFARIIIQILLVAAPLALLISFGSTLGTTGEWGHNFAEFLGDQPELWDSVLDAQDNGVVVSFTRFTKVTVMKKPAGYSKQAMQDILDQYVTQADDINKTRTNQLTNQNVIVILSESFSDPTKVPGLHINKDPMPYIRHLMGTTTSGTMVSCGYGGGTANLEFQEITGLSMANFSPSLTSPYQQLVPNLTWIPTFNQLWNTYAGGSLAVHPYSGSVYSRQSNYKKFGFQHFWTLYGPEYVKYKHKIDRSPYVDDQSAYDDVLYELKRNDSTNKYYQLETMQNHMSYQNWYNDNEYIATSTTGTPLSADEESQIETYAKGLEYTDKATEKFLNELDKINKPITVVWYGDHLPGIYESAASNKANSLVLHETPYFIWSNKASGSHATKLSAKDAAYTSPNFFMAQVAQQTNSKVSPYLAFLTRMHQAIPAMEPPVVNEVQGWESIPEGESLNVMSNGKQVPTKDLSPEAKKLLHQYQLIQYDITAGKHYLKTLTDDGMTFTSLPEAPTQH